MYSGIEINAGEIGEVKKKIQYGDENFHYEVNMVDGRKITIRHDGWNRQRARSELLHFEWVSSPHCTDDEIRVYNGLWEWAYNDI